jgi:hypothetical protein
MRPPLPGAPLALGLIGVLSLGGVMIGALPLPFAEARQPSTEVALRSHTIERDGTPLRIEYCGNGPLRPDTDVRRLLIMIHGTGGDACGYATPAGSMATGSSSRTRRSSTPAPTTTPTGTG